MSKPNTNKLPLIQFIIVTLTFLLTSNALAQEVPRLSGPERNALLAIAREHIQARLEGRTPRTPNVGARFQLPQPVAASLYLDGKLVARSWVIQRPGPLMDQLNSVLDSVLDRPTVGRSLNHEELMLAKVGVAALSKIAMVQDDSEIKSGQAVIILNGFKEALGLPGDLPGRPIPELLSQACKDLGLRPGTWLLPETSLLTATADEAVETLK